MSMCVEKSINYAEKQEIITMKIRGSSVTAKLMDCMTRKTAVTESLAMLLGIDAGDMEIVQPIKINQGVSIKIYVYANDKNADFQKILNNSNDTKGELGNIFKEGWNLSNSPTVSDINTVVVESKETKNSRIEMQLREQIDRNTKEIPFNPVVRGSNAPAETVENESQQSRKEHENDTVDVEAEIFQVRQHYGQIATNPKNNGQET